MKKNLFYVLIVLVVISLFSSCFTATAKNFTKQEEKDAAIITSITYNLFVGQYGICGEKIEKESKCTRKEISNSIAQYLIDEKESPEKNQSNCLYLFKEIIKMYEWKVKIENGKKINFPPNVRKNFLLFECIDEENNSFKVAFNKKETFIFLRWNTVHSIF